MKEWKNEYLAIKEVSNGFKKRDKTKNCKIELDTSIENTVELHCNGSQGTEFFFGCWWTSVIDNI